MTAPALVLSVSGLAALLALALSFRGGGLLVRRIAQASLWLALAAVPISIASDTFAPPGAVASDPSSRATRLGAAISHAMDYGALVIPFAGVAMFALRRANAARSQRRG